MVRAQAQIPKLRPHKASGQAAVVFEDGRYRHVGPWGSEKAQVAYDRLVAEWLVAGRRLPVAARAGPEGATVTELAAGYWTYAESYYRRPDGSPTRELANLKTALRWLRRLYGEFPAREFSPLKLMALRQAMLGEGWSRGYLNQQVGRVKRAFRWAVAHEIVPASVCQALQAVDGLRSGRTPAREPEPVRPVSDADVEAVLPLLSPPVRAMVELQRRSGMRPGEVVQMRMEDLDLGNEVWVYTPARQKTQHLGHEREVMLGPRAQAALKPFLRLDGGPLFRPGEALAWKHAREREERQTPLWASHERAQARRRQARSRRKVGETYSVDSYRRSIHRACEKAGLEPWSPNQLRHAWATEVRRKRGLEAAQTSLGHRNARVTEIYAERDRALACEVALTMG